MTLVEQVRTSARRIALDARHVRIDEARLAVLADRLKGAVVPAWDHELHYFDGTEKSVLYTLLLDAVNFCFWPSSFETAHNGKRYGKEDGYCALAVALKRAFEEDEPLLTEPQRMAMTYPNELEIMLDCEGQIPLLEERAANVRNLGMTLVADYDGDVRNLLAAARGDAVLLAEELATRFDCYDDVRPYRGGSVPILKRAQLCASDIAGSFGGRGPGALANADKLTCFADYKLPQLFHADGIFAYAPALDASVRGLKELVEGSEEEVEIRACTIDAVERLKGMLAARGRNLSAREIDWLLWNESIIPGRLSVPHHRTITTSY
ncbi:MAG TPA: queuosine salvage family protein [Candidatus Eisenbacteria bacterium]|nr:queuosine salvage family protein [Candidatus Eisenbacteria bacterium]